MSTKLTPQGVLPQAPRHGGVCARPAADARFGAAAQVAAPPTAQEEHPFEPRLSPIELRNRELINDPALEGYRVEGRSRSKGASPRAGDKALPELRAGGKALPELRTGDFRYTLRPDGSARLALYEGSSATVRIPAEADGHPVREIEPLLFADHDEIERLEVDGDDAHYSTDGLALFSAAGERFERLVVACERYRVPEGCRAIAERAFDSAAGTVEIELPDTLERIGRLAFAKSGVREMRMPASLRSIGEKAFYLCRSLVRCELSLGVVEIGAEAFASSALASIVLPATLSAIGERAFADTPAQALVGEGGIAFAEGATRFTLDVAGGLYCGEDFVELIGTASRYAVRPGTRRIAAAACRRNARLREISLPEGVVEIGAEAFRGCRGLTKVGLPASLEAIGARAFLDTGVRELSLGPKVGRIGAEALLVQGSRVMHAARPLEAVDVDARNASFYLESGLLCARGAGEDGGDACLLYVGPDTSVRIPEAVNRIEPNAFSGATRVEELFVHGGLRCICGDAFAVARAMSVVHVEYGRPVEGSASGDFPLPELSARYRNVTHLLAAGANGTVFEFGYYDSWVSHTADVGRFAPAAIARLANPVALTERMREAFVGIFRRRQAAACRWFARHGDLTSLSLLCDLGALDDACVGAELGAATHAGEAQATACLLELAHRRGLSTGVDFSL